MYLDDANAPAFYAGRQSAYPVGRLLLGAWRSSRLSLGHFVMTVGYRNAAKGCRALDVWLQAGEGPQELLTRVAASPWAPPVEELAWALDLSRRQRVAEQVRTAERAFRPLLQVRPAERRPSSITLHGLCGGTARLTRWLPEDVGQWTAEAQDAAVRAFAADFRQRFGERDPFFGPVTGHLLFLRYDASPWLFTPGGERVAPVEATPLGEARVSVNGRDLPSQWYAGRTPDATR